MELPASTGGKSVQHYTPDEATEFARRQRQEPSRAEHLLWQSLRGGRLLGVKFKRQVPFGVYTADFSCASSRLIVEIDGPSHTDTKAHDAERDRWFKQQGYQVLRFSDGDVLMATERVVSAIRDSVRTRITPSPDLLRRPPSPCSGEGRS
jgi:very-short-patch-repair endonuclease